MRWPFMMKSRHEQAVAALQQEIQGIDDAARRAVAEAAKWRVEYRKIRDRIVDIATHPGATPQIKATLAEFARFRP